MKKYKSLSKDYLDLEKTLVLTLDVVQGSCAPDNKFGANVEQNAKVAKLINSFVIAARALKTPIVHVIPETVKEQDFSKVFFGLDSQNDLIFRKKRFDVWQCIEFSNFVETNGITTLVVTGFEALACVQYAVLGAVERRLKVILLKDLVANAYWETWKEHVRTMNDVIACLYGVVCTSDDLLKAWSESNILKPNN